MILANAFAGGVAFGVFLTLISFGLLSLVYYFGYVHGNENKVRGRK